MKLSLRIMIDVAKCVRCYLVLSVILGGVFVPLDQRSFKRGQTRHELTLLFAQVVYARATRHLYLLSTCDKFYHFIPDVFLNEPINKWI